MAVTEVDVSKRTNTLLIGVQGEINAQTFHFDLSSWIEEYGSGGGASIDLQRPGESLSYTKSLTITDGVAEWTVDAVDNAIAGQGMAQIVYTTSGSAKKTKTATYVTMVEKALDEQHGDVPDPYKSYLDDARAIYSQISAALIEAARHEQAAAASQRAAEDAAEDAEASAARASQVFSVAGNVAFAINPDTSVTAIFTEEEE